MKILAILASCSTIFSIAHASYENHHDPDLACCDFSKTVEIIGESGNIEKHDFFEKRGWWDNLACVKKKAKEVSYEPANFTETIRSECIASFEAAYSEIKADALSVGDEIAYDSMRDQLLMILNNLQKVKAETSDTDVLETLTSEELHKTFQSAKATYINSKTHFYAFQPRDWDWFFTMAKAQNGVLSDRHRKIYRCHFDIIRGSMKFNARAFNVTGMDDF